MVDDRVCGWVNLGLGVGVRLGDGLWFFWVGSVTGEQEGMSLFWLPGPRILEA